MKELQNKTPVILTALIIMTGIALTVQAINKPLSDWGNYYYGSNLLVKGKFNADVYECYKFNVLVREQGETDVYLDYTPIPPFTALFYVPFQFTSSVTAKAIFNMISVLLFAVSILRMLKHLKIESYFLLLIPLALFMPLRSNIFFGQTYLLIISFLIEGYLANENGRKKIAAMFWAAAILLKLFPGIILLYLLFKKDFRAVIYTIGWILILSIITTAITGWQLNYEYFTYIMPRLFNNEINDTFAVSYQSAAILFRKLFIYDKLLNPVSLTDNFLLFKIINSLFTAIVVFICAAFSLSNDENKSDFLKFSFWITGGLLITGYGSNYSMILLVFVLVAIIKDFRGSVYKTGTALLIVLILTNLPINWFSKFSLLLQFPRLYLLAFGFIYIIFLYRVKVNFKYIFLIPIAAIVLTFISYRQVKDSSEYVLDKEEALLIYDYEESNGKLKIKFMDQNGKNEKELPMNISISPGDELKIVGRDVYYKDQKLTEGNYLNLKPMMLNRNEVIYLSDKYRGVNFYTLRKIKLNQ